MEKKVNKSAKVANAAKTSDNSAVIAQTSKRAQEIINKAAAKKEEAAGKGKVASKPAAVKVDKAPAKPKEKKVTLASLLDGCILKGGSWNVLVDAANKASKQTGATTKFNAGTVRAHINYRVKHNPNYLGGLKMTEEGIVAKGKKEKVTA